VPRRAPNRVRSGVGLFLIILFAMFFVYILKLKNGQHYIGFTRNLEKRLIRHKNHSSPTTSRIEPKDLVFYAAFRSKDKAIDFEQYLKSSSGFAFRNKRLV
jgi:predicted GIY-YIG superfamily endonuclease